MALFNTQTQSVNTPAVQTSTTVLEANEYRKGWYIQNQAATKLYVCLGDTASSTVYHFILPAASGAADGTGGTFSQLSGVVFTGKITCYNGGTPSYTVLEH
ncbi:MAG TPA: hypothetical protein VG961_09475 [Ignavibacteria bacterium]|nr:hypothetical protein [Ignavibacteria bacterium]